MYICIYVYTYVVLIHFSPPTPLSPKKHVFGRSFGGWDTPTRTNFASAGDEILVHWASSSPLMDHLQSEKSTAEKWREKPGIPWGIWIGDLKKTKKVHKRIVCTIKIWYIDVWFDDIYIYYYFFLFFFVCTLPGSAQRRPRPENLPVLGDFSRTTN